MNIIFTLSALRSVGSLSRLIKIAQADIDKYIEDAGHSATLIFENKFTNVQVGNMVSAVLRANPKVGFAMVSDLNLAEIQRLLDEVYEGEGTIVTRLVDKPLIEILN